MPRTYLSALDVLFVSLGSTPDAKQEPGTQGYYRSPAIHGETTVFTAEFGVYGPDGRWLIEGHGVDPDTVVDNLPHPTYTGSDAQLQAATAYLEGQIRLHPVPLPPAPAYPRKGAP